MHPKWKKIKMMEINEKKKQQVLQYLVESPFRLQQLITSDSEGDLPSLLQHILLGIWSPACAHDQES